MRNVAQRLRVDSFCCLYSSYTSYIRDCFAAAAFIVLSCFSVTLLPKAAAGDSGIAEQLPRQPNILCKIHLLC